MPQPIPSLKLSDWNPTRDTLHQYARIVGKIRGHYMPRSKHWWHVTLSTSARGLTTTPFPVGGLNVMELTLNLAQHQFVIASSDGWITAWPLAGQSAAGLCRRISATLASVGIKLKVDILTTFGNEEVLPYDSLATSHFLRGINWIDCVFKTFKNGLREETSPVHIFPHHFDLAMNWFSGRLVPGADPADDERADEQMNFGFVSGDSSVPDAYFYATAYPAPEGWTDLLLTGGAYWHTEGWSGAILPYAALLEVDDPQKLLLNFLQTVQKHGAELMN